MSIAPRDESDVTEMIESQISHEGPTIVQPEGWADPEGYSNGVIATGRIVTIAGQVGWNPATCVFESADFIGQIRQALHNVVDALLAAGARPSDLVRLTWYIVERGEYIAAKKHIGAAYREIIGNHYPAMSLVIVSGLLELQARVEIEATAVIPEHAS
ncbi:MAG TPA: RidA family protein [Gemmatimonadaceae bacterium]